MYNTALNMINVRLKARIINRMRSQMALRSRKSLIKSRGVIAASPSRIAGDATIDQRHLPVRVTADIALVGDHDDRAPIGIQFGEKIKNRFSGRFFKISRR